MNKSIPETVYDTVKGLYDDGIMDLKTMKKYEALCLPEIRTLKPAEIKKLRLREKISQALFARCLNVSTSTIQHWERGEKKPSGTALKLLNLILNGGLETII